MPQLRSNGVAQRMGAPDEIAEAAAFLLGEHAGFITGPTCSSTAAPSPPSDRRAAVAPLVESGALARIDAGNGRFVKASELSGPCDANSGICR